VVLLDKYFFEQARLRKDINWNSGSAALGSEIDTDNETELDCSKIEPLRKRRRR
jgi:hypothetical protein